MTTEFIPRDYQAAGIELIQREDGCALLYEPGSGKTVTALTALRPPYLVVAPKMVAQEVWTREAAKWSHTENLRVVLFDASVFDYKRKVTSSAIMGSECREIVLPGTPEDQDFLMCADVVVDRYELIPTARPSDILSVQADIYVVSRDHLYVLAKLLGDKWPWHTVLVDEASMFRNHDSTRSKTMDYLRRHKLVKKLVLMTGTPSPKGIDGLWALVRLLDGGKRLGKTLTSFRQRFMVPGDRNKKRIFNWRAKPGAREEVTQLISDICLSVRADVWRTTEEPRTVQRIVSIPMDQYEEMERELALEIGDGVITAQHAAVLQTKLLQMASGAVLDSEKKWHVVHDAKLDALEELVDELDGEPLLVVYWFQSSLARLQERFGKRLKTTKVKGFIDQFAEGNIELLAIQPAGAAHGLDGLQKGGHHVAIFDLFYDFELYQQVVSRLDRSGQQHRVTVHQLVAGGTKDMEVAPVLADRGADQGAVMDALRFKPRKK